MYGSHLSIAGSMTNALNEAARLGLDTVQVFTKNQQQWKAKPLEQAAIDEWRGKVRELGWEGRTVSHASYLINLASCNDELWEKSVALMRDEIERCEALGIPYLVHHPGSSVGWTREQGIARIAEAYERIFRETAGFKTVSCLEGTVGAGSTLGGPFEDLAELRRQIVERTKAPERVGFCLDTCHLHAAGHDFSSRAQAEAVLARFDAMCGFGNLKVFHINDSKGKAGSKLDRHAHIGEGWIGGGATAHSGEGVYSAAKVRASGFAAIVNHPRLACVPKILETPKEKDKNGRDMDAVNIERLKRLVDGNNDAAGSEPTVSGEEPSSRKPSRPPPVSAKATAASKTTKKTAKKPTGGASKGRSRSR